jgi:hypothetical protein
MEGENESRKFDHLVNGGNNIDNNISLLITKGINLRKYNILETSSIFKQRT